MKKIIIWIFLICIVLISIAYGLFTLSKSRTYQLFGTLIPRVSTAEKVVALTFDDAPSPYSNEVLQILNDKNVKATFYLIGSQIEKHPTEAKAIVDAGHEVGNHSYSHKRFLLKSPTFIKNEIEQTNSLIRQLGFDKEITFRPPNGKKLFGLPWYLSRNSITTVMWDVEPDTYIKSYNASTTDFIVDYAVSKTQSGSIILLHPFCGDNCSYDREALPQIIDKLKAHGYTFVTISELLTYQK